MADDKTVINYYASLPKKFTKKKRQYASYDKYHISVPTRVIVVGGTGSGKTNVVLNMVLGMNAWSRIYLVCKQPDEALYAFLADEIHKVEVKLNREIITVSTNLDDIPDIDDIDPRHNTLIIVDDVITEKTKKLNELAEFWTRGRKKNVSTIFITQSYYMVPKLIRSNSDIVIFKRLLAKDLTMIMSEFSLDRSVDELREMYKACHTNEVNSFFMIDQSPGQSPEYMYRHNFTPFQLE